MNTQQSQTKTLEKPSSASASSGLLQRQCACGNHTVAGDECSECSKKGLTLQRASISPHDREMEGQEEAPPMVHEVLRSPGQPLDSATRAFFEPRFGYDFSQIKARSHIMEGKQFHEPSSGAVLNEPGVAGDIDGQRKVLPEVAACINRARGTGRPLENAVKTSMESAFGSDFTAVRIHTNTEADTFSRLLHARAFTIGQDVFFRQGSYKPATSSGRGLLAHELTHVIQQGSNRVPGRLSLGKDDSIWETEANRAEMAAQHSLQSFISSLSSEPLHENPFKQEMNTHRQYANSTKEQETILRAPDESANKLKGDFYNPWFDQRDKENLDEVKHESSIIYNGMQFIVNKQRADMIEQYGGKFTIIGEFKDGKVNPLKERKSVSKSEALPSFTHINGIWTSLETGINEAKTLSEYLGGKDVLFTYNASEGKDKDIHEAVNDKWLGEVLDGDILLTSVDYTSGKLLPIDTYKQVELIEDAVENSKHIFMSAFSQGSIKLNTAVKFAVNKIAKKIVDEKKQHGIAEIEQAKKEANAKVEQFVHLFYSGVAAWYPVDFADETVAQGDMVNILSGNHLEPQMEISTSPHSFWGINRSPHDFALGEKLPKMGEKLSEIGKGIQDNSDKLKLDNRRAPYDTLNIHINNLNGFLVEQFGDLYKVPKVLNDIVIKLRASISKIAKVDIRSAKNDIETIRSDLIKCGDDLKNIGNTLKNEKSIYSREVAGRMLKKYIEVTAQNKYGFESLKLLQKISEKL